MILVSDFIEVISILLLHFLDFDTFLFDIKLELPFWISWSLFDRRLFSVWKLCSLASWWWVLHNKALVTLRAYSVSLFY